MVCPRVDGAAVQATEEALAEVVRQRVEVRRLHNSVRTRYHKLMQTASAAEMALFHSHNDGIRFIAWMFASIKVGSVPGTVCSIQTHRRDAPIWRCVLPAMAACAALLAQKWSTPESNPALAVQLRRSRVATIGGSPSQCH